MILKLIVNEKSIEYIILFYKQREVSWFFQGKILDMYRITNVINKIINLILIKYFLYYVP